MYKIMIVEDDMLIAKSIKEHLQSWGFEAMCVENFKHVELEYASYNPQLVLMDLKLPFYNGYHWCEEIRKLSKVPIIFISSANDNMNIVMAMSMGADDFISKPFDFEVLVAKIQAILRRSYDFNGQTSLMEHEGVILNMDDYSIHYKEERIELSKNEARILKTLLDNKGKIVGRQVLMNQLWKTDCFIDENTLSVNIARLRKRLESIGVMNFIQTKKGEGYMIE